MSKLSPEQIAQSAHHAGFRGNDLTTAVAIALAESAGNPKAHNAVPPDNSYGLWQINMIGALGPDRRHEFHLHSNSELFDPKTNAAAAFDISGSVLARANDIGVGHVHVSLSHDAGIASAVVILES